MNNLIIDKLLNGTDLILEVGEATVEVDGEAFSIYIDNKMYSEI